MEENNKRYKQYMVYFIMMFILGIGALSLAWFTSNKTASVKYDTLSVDAQFVGFDSEGENPQNNVSIVPGDIIDKNISIKPNSTTPSFIRVKLNGEWKDSNNSLVNEANNIDYIYVKDSEGNSVVSNEIIDNKWYKDGEYLYYIDVVNEDANNKNEISLLDAIEFTGNQNIQDDTSYQDKTLSVNAELEVIQAKNNAYEDLWAIENQKLNEKLGVMSSNLSSN